MSFIQRLDGFTADGFGSVISGDPQAGDVIRIDGRVEQRYTPPTPVQPSPRLLSKTGFMDHVISVLGGIDRFMEVFEGCRDSTDPTHGATLRYAYERYQAAITLDKTVATSLFNVMRAAGVITQDERDAAVNGWPS